MDDPWVARIPYHQGGIRGCSKIFCEHVDPRFFCWVNVAGPGVLGVFGAMLGYGWVIWNIETMTLVEHTLRKTSDTKCFSHRRQKKWQKKHLEGELKFLKQKCSK